jgi:exodeoxyribonuclease-3
VLIQAWNIQAGGGTRLDKIFEEIIREGADTVVLGETTQHRLPDLKTGLRTLGFVSIHAPKPPDRKRGVLIASKRSFLKKPPSAGSNIEKHRWAEVWFPKERVRLAGLYFPDTAKPIMAMWPRVLEAATKRRDERYILIGDLNSGHSAFDTEGVDLSSDPWFAAMPFHGMIDLWRHKHRDARDFSWFSNHKGTRRGFRIDHAFGTTAIRRRVRRIWYTHDARLKRISDHSALMLELR